MSSLPGRICRLCQVSVTNGSSLQGRIIPIRLIIGKTRTFGIFCTFDIGLLLLMALMLPRQ